MAAPGFTAAKDNIVSLGFVTGLDYQDPRLDPQHVLQSFKQHPFVAKLLAGGKMIRYGAKSLPYGGWWSLPPLGGRWLDDHRRLRRLPELRAPQRHSPRHQERHARRRNRLRSPDQRRFLQSHARPVPTARRNQLDQGRALARPQFPPGIRERHARRHDQCRPPDSLERRPVHPRRLAPRLREAASHRHPPRRRRQGSRASSVPPKATAS